MNTIPNQELQEDEEMQPQQSRNTEFLPSRSSLEDTELFPDQVQRSGDTKMIQEQSQEFEGTETFTEHDVVTQEPKFLKCIVEATTKTKVVELEVQKLYVVTQEQHS